MNVMWCWECKLYYWTKANKVSVQLITNNKSFNVRQNISQGKSRFYTKIIVFQKPSLLHVDLRGDLRGFIAVADVLTVYLKNVSLICRYISPLFNFINLYYQTCDSLIEDFLQCHKIQNNFFLWLRGFNFAKDFSQYRRKLTNISLRLI